jgi:beta-glucosidase
LWHVVAVALTFLGAGDHPRQEGEVMTVSTNVDYDDLIGRLDLPTKVRLLTGAATFNLYAEESIGLGELRLSDGPTGVRGLKFSGGRTVSLFPNATLLSAAWSEDTAYEVGQLLAEEAMAQEIHVVLGPTINLHRSLLGGRLFEAYSEDPLLSGKLAAAYVRGLQESGVGACLKHLVANESETERNTVDSVVDEATLRELYLLPFEIAVSEANAWSIMDAYNDVNGTAATEHDHVNNEIVKGEWAYDGLIMSDWFATKSAAASANGGLDLVMPGPASWWIDGVIAAVAAGEVDEAVIDDHVRRLLRLADRTGALSTPRSYPDDLPTPDSPQRKEQLRRLAASGITVLTNNGDVLPLARDAKVALIGRHAIETTDMGGGSAQVNPPYQVSVAEGLTALLGEAVSVVDGVEVRDRQVAARPEFVSDPVTGEAGVHITLLTSDDQVLEERTGAVATAMVGFDDDFGDALQKVRFAARLATDGPVQIGASGAGRWELTVADQTVAFDLHASAGGMGDTMLAPPADSRVVSVAIGDVLEAIVTRHPVTDDSNPLAAVGLFSLIARAAPRDADEVIAEAAEAARDADIAVLVVGLTEEQETEAVDKSTLTLPGKQDDLVRVVAAAAVKTVVVVNAATPVIMPWLDEVDAVLWAGLPGQEGGHAVAAALLGDIEPAGRLVTTFPVADGATPAWNVSPIDGAIVYREGTYIGYRGHYAGKAEQPAFWLGHGLGYSTWSYESASIVDDTDPAPVVSVRLTNTGSRSSREVVQVYAEPATPEQQVRLVGWNAVTLGAGESSVVEVTTDARLWRRWNTELSRWGEPLPHDGRLLVARGLGDIRITLPLG